MPSTINTTEAHLERQRFKKYAREQEYTEETTTSYCRYVSQFLEQYGIPPKEIFRDSVLAFLTARQAEYPKSHKYCRAALKLYYQMVIGDKLKMRPDRIVASDVAILLKRFYDYSVDVKHLKEETVIAEIDHVRRFLEFTCGQDEGERLPELSAESLRNYVIEGLVGLQDSSKGRHITSLRNFFRCQSFLGEPVHPSIFRLPLSPAVWTKSAFPTTIDVDVFNRLHEISNDETATGKRNRCIIMCFTELALRCCEVAALSIDDFNWHEKYVMIHSAKYCKARILPLSKMLFDALIGYLLCRPQAKSRALFVRFAHLRGEPMGRCQIRNVIRRNGAKAGLPDYESGTHILRRTAASKLYNAGNSLKLTADILGHVSLHSTTRYTKTDTTMLLSAASPWPGGECHD